MPVMQKDAVVKRILPILSSIRRSISGTDTDDSADIKFGFRSDFYDNLNGMLGLLRSLRDRRPEIQAMPEPPERDTGDLPEEEAGVSSQRTGYVPAMTGLLRIWNGHPYYERLNRTICQCAECGDAKYGFVPSYGMGFVEIKDDDMDEYRPEVFIVSDPPLNVFVRSRIAHHLSQIFVTGKCTGPDYHRYIASRQSIHSASLVAAEYPGFIEDAPYLLREALLSAGFDPERILISSMGRCFLKKSWYREVFDAARQGPACGPWIVEELDFLIKSGKPRGILALSSHFCRIIMGISKSLDELRVDHSLEYNGIPLQVIYHPMTWRRKVNHANDAVDDIKSLYRRIYE